MDEKEIEQYRRLVLTPIGRLILYLAVPTVISMMITMIYNLVDAFFVGKLGTSASASIGILVSVQSIFQAIGFMFGHGSGSNISVLLGNGKVEEANKTASLGFFAALVVSIVPAILGLLFLTPLMRLLGSTETILPFARRYGFYIFLSGPALSLSCVLNNIMRYEGKAFYSMIGLVSGGILNMIGDPILMFYFGMGIDGAGLSTALSQYISLGILGYMFLSGKTISVISVRHLKRDESRLFHIVKNGLPSLIRQSLNSISTMTLNICAMPYGDAAIAAMAIVGRLAMFMGAAMIGIGQGFQPVSAYNYGAQKYRRIRESVKFTLIASEILMVLIGAAMFVLPEPIIRLFRDDHAVVQIGVRALRFQSLAMVLQPLCIVTNMLFQSIGKSKVASFVASLRSGLYYIPVVMIAPKIFGIIGVQSAQLVADILSAVTCIFFLVPFFKKLPMNNVVTDMDRIYQDAVRNLNQKG